MGGGAVTYSQPRLFWWITFLEIPIDGFKRPGYFAPMKANARITRVELVNGDMTSYTLKAEGQDYDYNFEGLGTVLNTSGIGRGLILVTVCGEPEFAIGDEVTEGGDVVRGGAAVVAEATTLRGPASSHKDYFLKS